jgi:hypothetical protein
MDSTVLVLALSLILSILLVCSSTCFFRFSFCSCENSVYLSRLSDNALESDLCLSSRAFEMCCTFSMALTSEWELCSSVDWYTRCRALIESLEASLRRRGRGGGLGARCEYVRRCWDWVVSIGGVGACRKG